MAKHTVAPEDDDHTNHVVTYHEIRNVMQMLKDSDVSLEAIVFVLNGMNYETNMQVYRRRKGNANISPA